MKKSSPILLMIQRSLPELSGKARTIAEQILKNPDLVVREKAADLAKRCNADSAQVVRLCQKFGFSGFPDLKARLMEGFLTQWNTLERQIAPNDNPVSCLKQQVGEEFKRTINNTMSELDDVRLRQAVDMLSNARNIYLAGAGASALAARDMQIKLLRLGYSAVFFDDQEVMNSLCRVLSPEDLLIVFSFSGRTGSMIDLVDIARKNAVPVLGMTNYPASPLAEKSTLFLLTTAEEDKIRVGAMSSLLSQILVEDLLISLLAGLDRKRTEQRVNTMTV
jgi:DNA-binding MurR/RpiR family transcriptional regulator